MYGIISSPKYLELYKSVNNSDLVFQSIDNFDELKFIQACHKVSRITLNHLMIDMTCAPDEALVKGIISVVLNRPETRIILICMDRTAGDKTISELVSSGIYDIVSLTSYEEVDQDVYEGYQEKIRDILENPQKLADAFRWKGNSDHYDFSLTHLDTGKNKLEKNKTKTKYREIIKTEIKKEIVTIQTNSWFVINLTSRAGASLITQSLAKLWANSNFDVRVTESPYNNPTFLYSTGYHEEIPLSILENSEEHWYEEPYRYGNIRWDLKTTYHKNEYNEFELMKLLLKVSGSMSLIDLGDCYFEKPEILQHARKLLVVVEPDINNLWECRKRKKQLNLLEKSGIEIIYIINKSHHLISEDFGENNGFNKVVYIPTLSPELIYKKAQKNQLLLENADDIDENFIHALKKLSEMMHIPIANENLRRKRRPFIRLPFSRN